MAKILQRWADDNVSVYGNRIRKLNEKFPKVLPRIVNQVGNRAKTVVIRELTQQTGLPRKTIVKAVGNPAAARPGKLSYEMVTRGGFIRLKYLRARETRAGVIARPFGKPKLYPHAFMRGGWFPNRKTVPDFNGHAMIRFGRSPDVRGGSRHYTYARSDVRIPYEMTTGATRAAFIKIAGPLLQQRVGQALAKLVP